jgi:hypothetical protein
LRDSLRPSAVCDTAPKGGVKGEGKLERIAIAGGQGG